MSADFVPFRPAIRAATPAAAPQNSFAPAKSAPVAPPPPPKTQDVKVEVKRAGDRITHLQIHCRCGEVIEIECDY